MDNRLPIFISSKQSELEEERAVLADKIRSLMFFEPVMAEEWPPQRADIRQVFLEKVRQAPIYIGLFHSAYSAPTEDEYHAAGENPHREMLIYVKRSEGNPIDPQLEALLGRIKQERVIYQFRHLGELLPLFTDHLRSAVSRMVMLLQKLGEPAPASRGGGVLKARWERERKAIEGIGLPGDPAAAAGLARALAANS
jgi:hypothetical protein